MEEAHFKYLMFLLIAFIYTAIFYIDKIDNFD